MKTSTQKTQRENFQSLEISRPVISNHWKFSSAALGILVCCAVARASLNPDSIANTRHNLSANGPGAVKSLGETEVCIFCHTPHGSVRDAPLWNRFQSAAVYTPYSSSTMKARPGQPTGASKLCLSCHDGTVAMGMVRSRKNQIKMSSGNTVMAAGSRSNLGTDLSDDHPISFVYDDALARMNGELRDPATLTSAVRLDKDSQLQCTSCHDPHSNRYGKFLVQENNASSLCLQCHDPQNWQTAVHRMSTATWNGSAPNPWPRGTGGNVQANACASCHAPHSAGTKEQLLNLAGEEQNCFPCHNGHVASQNIQAEFQKISIHNVATTTGVHTPVEDLVNSPRHVECADCHNSHAAKHAPAKAPAASGSLAGVRGVGAGGSPLLTVQNEFELCFRCHGDSANKAAARVNRVSPQTNTRLEFSPSNISFHPVESQGHSQNVPSLRQPYTVNSVIYCTDCHNNNAGPNAGGSGPNGPHGSSFVPLLERQLVTTDYSSESETIYALCYKCHDRQSILSDASFKYHSKHIVEQQTACTTCHDSHGAGSSGLINFNTDYVKPLNGKIEWVSQGNFSGTCTMLCHTASHDRISTQQGTQNATPTPPPSLAPKNSSVGKRTPARR